MVRNDSKFTKSDVVSIIKELNFIIERCCTDNCYDRILEFFAYTSYIQDRKEDIKKLPIKGQRFWRKKTQKREFAEHEREKFFIEIERAGRDLSGHNKTMPGEDVTKEKIFFGCDPELSIARWESTIHFNDEAAREKVKHEIVAFIWSFYNLFKTDWLA